MKLFECEWLRPSSGRSGFSGTTYDLWVCDTRLRRLWEVPAEATAVKIFLHSRPAKERVKITGTRDRGWRDVFPWSILLDEPGMRSIRASPEQVEYVNSAIEYNNGKPVYAELWYEENT